MPAQFALAKALISLCLPCLDDCGLHQKGSTLQVCCPISTPQEKNQNNLSLPIRGNYILL